MVLHARLKQQWMMPSLFCRYLFTASKAGVTLIMRPFAAQFWRSPDLMNLPLSSNVVELHECMRGQLCWAFDDHFLRRQSDFENYYCQELCCLWLGGALVKSSCNGTCRSFLCWFKFSRVTASCWCFAAVFKCGLSALHLPCDVLPLL